VSAAANLGGGIDNNGTTTLIRTLVRFNQALGAGRGGIRNAAGTVTLRDSVVSTNSHLLAAELRYRAASASRSRRRPRR
jgi:hypothetical protein